MTKQAKWIAAAFAVLSAQASTIVNLPSATNITVEAGKTLSIDYLAGGTTLYKSGEGRLEVAVIGNTNLNIVVSNGTFATIRPTSLDLSGDGNVIFHLDACKASTLTTYSAGGTNFVTGIADADGRTDRSLSTLSGRPDAFISAAGPGALPAVDLGSLSNKVASGYGAALAFSSAVTTAHEVFYVFQDDPDAKNRARSIGPCITGSSAAMHVRGYVDNGTNAPIHYASGIAGRAQDGNYIDGTRYGTTGGLYYKQPVPDGVHVMRRKISYPTYNAFDSISGLGYSTHSEAKAYGGLKICEAVFLADTTEADSISETSSFYQTYLMRKWLDAASAGKITLMNDSVLDVSAAPLRAQMQWAGTGATITGGANLWPKGYYEAGNPAVAASGVYEVPPFQTLLPGMAFSGDAAIAVAGTATVSRLEGTGTLRKTGPGRLSLGAHGTGLSSIDVQGGTLRIAPLEASGSWMHVDASQEATITRSDATHVSKWTDAENGVNYLSVPNVSFAFDTSRKVGSPFISDRTQNGLPLMDFGTYTTELYPDGEGCAFVPNLSPYATGVNIPGVRNLFAVWGDYDEVKNLPSNVVNGVAKGLRGPSIYGGPSNYGLRGEGGGGAAFTLLYKDCPGRYITATGYQKIDGKTIDPKVDRPSDGMHVLDHKASDPGASLDYVGGIRWASAYDGGSGSGTHTGVWGGLRMGEMLIYRNALPEWFRARIADALGTKWFNRTNALSYASISVAPGASLEIPDTWVAATSLSLAGTLETREICATNVAVVSGAEIAGSLAVADGGTISFAASGGELPALSASAFSAQGRLTLSFDLGDGGFSAYTEAPHLAVAAASPAAGAETIRATVTGTARELGIRATATVGEDGISVSFIKAGLRVIVR